MNFSIVDRAAGTIILQSLEKPDKFFRIYICIILSQLVFFSLSHLKKKHQDIYTLLKIISLLLEITEKIISFQG